MSLVIVTCGITHKFYSRETWRQTYWDCILPSGKGLAAGRRTCLGTVVCRNVHLERESRYEGALNRRLHLQLTERRGRSAAGYHCPGRICAKCSLGWGSGAVKWQGRSRKLNSERFRPNYCRGPSLITGTEGRAVVPPTAHMINCFGLF